uniref:KIND domain-containing protein n=1 Tax=Gopherus agassizii TaxID=38772 RepID=A0A452J787_9SAUR
MSRAGCAAAAAELTPSCEWRNVTKVSLGEFLRCFDQPISEEQAWALCFQCCHKMKQLAQGPYPVVIKGLGSILIHSDGAVSFMVYPKSGKNKGTGGLGS